REIGGGVDGGGEGQPVAGLVVGADHDHAGRAERAVVVLAEHAVELVVGVGVAGDDGVGGVLIADAAQVAAAVVGGGDDLYGFLSLEACGDGGKGRDHVCESICAGDGDREEAIVIRRIGIADFYNIPVAIAVRGYGDSNRDIGRGARSRDVGCSVQASNVIHPVFLHKPAEIVIGEFADTAVAVGGSELVAVLVVGVSSRIGEL